MKQYSLMLAALAGLGTNVSSANELLPPPYLKVTVTALDVASTRVELGKQYMIYIATKRDGSYSALLVREDGVEVHSDLPVRLQGCSDTALPWPDSAGARVRASSDPTVAQLVVTPFPVNGCTLDLTIPSGGTIPARPYPGIPN